MTFCQRLHISTALTAADCLTVRCKIWFALLMRQKAAPLTSATLTMISHNTSKTLESSFLGITTYSCSNSFRLKTASFCFPGKRPAGNGQVIHGEKKLSWLKCCRADMWLQLPRSQWQSPIPGESGQKQAAYLGGEWRTTRPPETIDSTSSRE